MGIDWDSTSPYILVLVLRAEFPIDVTRRPWTLDAPILTPIRTGFRLANHRRSSSREGDTIEKPLMEAHGF